MKNNFLIITSLLFVLISCNSNEDQVPIKQTAQELILGNWTLDRITTDINDWVYEKGEITITFSSDSSMIINNDGVNESIFPLGISQSIYYFEKKCLSTDLNATCDDEDKIMALIINEKFNTFQFKSNNKELRYGIGFEDSIDYHLSRITD